MRESDQLHEIISYLKDELEKSTDFVSEQEEELNLHSQTIADLEAKLKTAEGEERFRLELELAHEKEAKHLLEETLIGQRRNLQQRAAIYRLVRQQQNASIENGSVETNGRYSHPEPKLEQSYSKYQEKPTRSWWSWTIALLVISLLAGGAAMVYGFKFTNIPTAQLPSPEPASPTTPPPTPVVNSISALGRIEPQGEVIRIAPPPNLGGSKVDKLLVKEGDWVQAGQVVAMLDNYDRKLSAVQMAQEEIKVARANLAIVKAGAKQGEVQAQEAAIARLEAQLAGEVATNQAGLDRLEAQLQGEQATQTATVKRLEAELANAQTEFQRYQQLALEGAISASELDRRRLTLETARESVEEAKANYEKTVNTLNEQIREGRANVQKTVDTLQQQIREARANLNRITEVRGVDVQKAQAEVDRAIANLKQNQADLELAYIKAPSNGQILKIHSYAGERVDEGKGIADLGRTDRMLVVAEVYESDVSKVRTGQQATITSENKTFEGEIRGTVEEIGLQIGKKDVLNTDPAADVDVRVIEVKILLDSESSRRVAGLTNAKVFVKIVP